MGLFSPKISTRELVPMCRELATAYDAGIPILKGLQLMERNAASNATREVLLEMRTAIQAGATLGDAARAQEKRLPPFFVELLSSGERGGRLDVMLRDLADYYEDRLRIQRAVMGAMAYPIFITAACWFLGSFSLGLVGNLSLDPRARFSIGEYIEQWLRFQGVSLLVLAAALALLWALGRTGIPQRAWGLLATRLWPFSAVTRKFALSRFFRSLALLVGAGINIRHSIEQAARTTANSYMTQDLLQALPVVARGGTLAEAFAQCRTLMPVDHEMIAVGEASGKLDLQLRKASEYHFAEAQLAMKVALRSLSILLVLAAGAMVGFIIISFYSRLFSLYDSI
jgi:type IV pilus assembly protein PilC